MAALTTFKWNGPALVAYNEKQLAVALKEVAKDFQKIVRKRASIFNKGRVFKLKRKKKRTPRFFMGLTAEKDKKGRTEIVKKRGQRFAFPIIDNGNLGWRTSKFIRKNLKGKSNKTQITLYPNSSSPGTAVRARTGIGQKNIVAGWEKSRSRVGYTKNARYMMFHELGIKYKRGVQKRPLMIPALRDSRPQLVNVMRTAADRTKP